MDSLDHLQFGQRGTDDATVSMVQSQPTVPTLVRGFPLQRDSLHADSPVLVRGFLLIDIGVNGGIIHLVRDFLSDSPQLLVERPVLVNNRGFLLVVLNTGAPQGTILSPLLFLDEHIHKRPGKVSFGQMGWSYWGVICLHGRGSI